MRAAEEDGTQAIADALAPPEPEYGWRTYSAAINDFFKPSPLWKMITDKAAH